MDSVTSPRPAVIHAFRSPSAMPAQSFERVPLGWRRVASHPAVYPWRMLVALLAVVPTVCAAVMLARVLGADGFSVAECLLIAVFSICTLWLAFGFALGVIGYIGLKFHARPAGMRPVPLAAANLPPEGKTAVLMPLRNEDTGASMGRLLRVMEDVVTLGIRHRFDFHILSDSNRADVIEAERAAAAELGERNDLSRVFYRNRTNNLAKKAGNIADFCRNSGSNYDYMLILDADSLLAGRTLATLARLMDANPDAGIVQVSPSLTRGETVFSELRHISSRLYGQICSAGYALVSGGEGNYWGHHAIIRVRAFMANCGLPELPGQPPLGGPVMSHDFVEAALIRRAGWRVWLAFELTGAVEDNPPSLIDEARRDRRWCAGNLQHMRVARARGLHPMNRLHMAIGIMSYVASPLWLAFILLSLIVMPGAPAGSHATIGWLFAGTMAMLFGPRLLGIAHVLRQGRDAKWAVIGAAIREQLYAILMAPVMMVWQTEFVVGILSGRDHGWGAQSRGARSLGFRELASTHWTACATGIVLAVVTLWLSPSALPWVAPMIAGLIASPFLTWATGQALPVGKPLPTRATDRTLQRAESAAA